MAVPKRVACFYRVSTKGQMDGDDIPMQRRSCHDFVEKQGWVIVKEYTEKGVSGYRVSADDRDEIQRAKSDAENGVFDVLLCFMFDRLGRKQDETPFVLKWFSKKGVELWSVMEGQQKFSEHTDDLMNFIRFWQSSGESKKTSMRVNEKHEQMVQDGLFRGGKPPYGYSLEKSGEINKKGKELFKLVINEEQSKIIEKIYDLVYYEGYGSNRIVKWLNDPEKRIKSYTGSNWATGTVNFILKNPIYKGYMAYGKGRYNEDNSGYERQDRDKWIMSLLQNTEIVIVSEEKWDKVQVIRSSRSPDKVKDDSVHRVTVTKSPLLFVGSIKCGHCGSPLTTTYNTKVYKVADGTVKKWVQAKYRCSGKALGKTDCAGQTIYSQKRIETSVLDEIDQYLNELREVDFDKEISEFERKNISGSEKQSKSLQKTLETKYGELSTLKAEVTKSILGQSPFKPEMLSGLIEDKEKEIQDLNRELDDLRRGIDSKKIEVSEMENLKNSIPSWKREFEAGTFERKKMMLSHIVNNITVKKDMIELDVKLNVRQFIASVGQYNHLSGTPQYAESTAHNKYITRNFKIVFNAA